MTTTIALFSVSSHLYNHSDPPTAVSLHGGPILGTISTLTVYRNTVDATVGTLPKFSPVATIVARPSEWDALATALNASPQVVVLIYYVVIDGKRNVTQIDAAVTALKEHAPGSSEDSRSSEASSASGEPDSGAFEEAGCGGAVTQVARGRVTSLAWLGMAVGLLWVRRRKIAREPRSDTSRERKND